MEDESKIDQVNSFFPEDTRGFVSVEEPTPKHWYGGTKMLETPLFIGAFNHLVLEDLIVWLKGIKWEEPENVQLIVKEQEDDRFSIYDFSSPPHKNI